MTAIKGVWIVVTAVGLGVVPAGVEVCATRAGHPGAVRGAASAADVVRAAIVDRLGADSDVAVVEIDAPAAAGFREARPDPAAWLGKPVRFTLITDAGGAVPAVATLRVVVTHVVAKKAIGRGHVVALDDVEAVRAELQGTPIRPVPTMDQVAGARALRPIAPGATVLAGFVALRRPVEPGDRVTVVATSGAVEVTAEFVAADGGRVGDTIRVVNPDTKKYVRGRVVRKGLVEVINER